MTRKANSAPADPERIATYKWEAAVVPREKSYPSLLPDELLPDELLAFYRDAWRSSVARWPQSRFEHLNGEAPTIVVDRRLTRHAAKAAGVRFGIRIGPKGLSKHTILHEIAHMIGPPYCGHDAVFRRIALDLYVEHFAVDELTAVSAAKQAGLAIAGPDWQSLPESWPYNSRPGVPKPRI